MIFEIKNIFYSIWRAIIWWKIKVWEKIAGTSFKNVSGSKAEKNIKDI